MLHFSLVKSLIWARSYFLFGFLINVCIRINTYNCPHPFRAEIGSSVGDLWRPLRLLLRYFRFLLIKKGVKIEIVPYLLRSVFFYRMQAPEYWEQKSSKRPRKVSSIVFLSPRGCLELLWVSIRIYASTRPNLLFGLKTMSWARGPN